MADFFDDIKTFEEVRQDMEKAYDEYLKTGEEDTLWEIAHQVLSNALFVLNEDDVEDEFVYEFPFITESGQDYDDDSPALAVWEIYNIANALYKMTEPLAYILYR